MGLLPTFPGTVQKSSWPPGRCRQHPHLEELRGRLGVLAPTPYVQLSSSQVFSPYKAQDWPSALCPPKKGRRHVREKALYQPACGGRSAPHADSPGVGAEHALPPAHHAGVRALVDGVGDDAQVRLTQRQVAGVGELQGLLVLVPAAEAAGRQGGRARRVRAPPPAPAVTGAALTTLCLSCGESSGHSGRSRSCPRAPAWFWSWGAAR